MQQIEANPEVGASNIILSIDLMSFSRRCRPGWIPDRLDSPGGEVKISASNRGEIGEDAADEAGELEAVPAARRGDDHVDAARQRAEPEMVVGRQGVEADLGRVDRGPGQRGEVAAAEAADDLGERQAIRAIPNGEAPTR